MKPVYGQRIPAAKPTPLLAALVALVAALIVGGMLALIF